MSQNLGLSTRNQLHMIHNVRPAMELSSPTRLSALTMMTFGVLIAAALLLVFLFGG